VSVSCPALLQLYLFWWPEIPGRRGQVSRRWRCGSRAGLLWRESPWSEFCDGHFGWFSDGFSHSFASVFDSLRCLLNILFDFLPEVKGPVINFTFSCPKIVSCRGGAESARCIACWTWCCGMGTNFSAILEVSMVTFGFAENVSQLWQNSGTVFLSPVRNS